ncbi:MAG: hypothetical protein M3P38_07030 [Chloroflexota bacterium]|nr:hypothetical protein [Chloroflexota bacterium]
MRVAISSAGLTTFVLIPGAILGLAAGAVVNERMPWYSSDALRFALPALAALTGMFAGGAVWGSAMSRLTKAAAGRRMALAGGTGFASSATLVALTLSFLGSLVLGQSGGPALPVHNVFTLLFAPAAGIVAGVSGAALGLGLGDRAIAGKLAWMCALAGGAAFLVVNLTMDALGWRVGAPGAAERATMLTTTLLGSLAAAITGGAIIGIVLWTRTRARFRMTDRE